jgi:hypothetical protein
LWCFKQLPIAIPKYIKHKILTIYIKHTFYETTNNTPELFNACNHDITLKICTNYEILFINIFKSKVHSIMYKDSAFRSISNLIECVIDIDIYLTEDLIFYPRKVYNKRNKILYLCNGTEKKYHVYTCSQKPINITDMRNFKECFIANLYEFISFFLTHVSKIKHENTTSEINDCNRKLIVFTLIRRSIQNIVKKLDYYLVICLKLSVNQKRMSHFMLENIGTPWIYC